MREIRTPTWATRMSRAESLTVLDRLMNEWYDGVRADRGLCAAVGFETSMERRDWEGAKGSIERTYGRATRDHQASLDTLAAAIFSKRLLGRDLVR
ncbi:MAG TPA: hypothetical protein VFK92_17795 [Burkholderiales bacterium]|nr:hypothetical protein [Burkholderiales bacterium]